MADEQQPTTEVQVTKTVKGTLGISVTNPTPMWATWAFRIEFFLNKSVLIYLAGTKHMTVDHIQELLLIFSAIDVFVWGIGRSLGIKPPDESDSKNQ